MFIKSVFKAVWILGLAGLIACEKDITDKVKVDSTKQLVVTCFISPQDTILQARVIETKPILGKYPADGYLDLFVNNATVQLSDGSKTIALPQAYDTGIYQAKASDFPIVAGKTYTLTVSVPDGRKVIASCVIPVTDDITITDIQHTEEIVTYDYNPNSFKEHTFQYKWQDAPGHENYYLPLAVIDEQYPNPPPNQPIGRDLIIVGEETYVSDDKNDGAIFTSQKGEYSTSADDGANRPFIIHAHLVVSDRHYYLYHRSVYLQNNVKDNPFAEPAIIYSNVQGGLGVFSGYNQLKKIFRVE